MICPAHRGLPLIVFGLLVLVAVVATPATAVTIPWPEPVYTLQMDVDYDADTFRLTGVQHLRWHNTSQVEIQDLWFHHYLNAFANNRSTFMKGSGGQLRGDTFDGKRWGWIEVTAMTLPDGTDLKAVEQYVAPDDGNAEDRTVARYPLPQPLPPGEWIELEIHFEAQFPTIFARTGAVGDYVLGGQWFPKIAVFETAGMRGREEPGWNCHQFHPNSEFYADFGNYDVTLTLPERYQGKIGATGQQLSEEVADGKVTVRFAQDAVHDFAWTAWPKFLVYEERFDPQTDVPAELRQKISDLLGLPPAELDLLPVDLKLFVGPAHDFHTARFFEAAKAAIRSYGMRLAPYPWPTMTMVDPPYGARGSGGMEYPTLITLGTDNLTRLPIFENTAIREPGETVTVHEYGHNFFQGMLANNEFEESWLDEGFNSYMELVAMEENYGETHRFFGTVQPRFEQERNAVVGGEFQDAMATRSWEFYSGGSYARNSYPRTAVTLRHMERLLGEATFARALRAYFQEFRFRHPSTADFERVVEEVTGQDLGWFYAQALHGTEVLDYSIRRLKNDELRKPKGFFWEQGARVEYPKDEAEGEGEEEVADDSEGAKEDEKIYESQVTVFRDGGFRHPVTVELTFDDGTVERKEWDGQDRWHRYRFLRTSKLEKAVVDPDGILALESNRLNNGRTTEEDGKPATAITVQLLGFVQTFLQLMSVVG
jgi:hypothetical protein